MQGMILAAGMGRRLKELTENNTKCMVKVNGVTLIERMLRQLDRLNLDRIVIVVGYEGQKLMDYIATLDISTPIVYVDNPIYDRTNNIYSLGLAKDYLLQDDTLLLESDLIFEDSVLQALADDPRETLALVNKYESWMDGTCITITGDDHIDSFVSGKKLKYDETDEYYKTVNLYKFSRDFSKSHYVPFLDAYVQALGNNEYYEQVLRIITMLDDPVIRAKKLDGQLWYEIDDIQDLDIASVMFCPDENEKLKRMQSRYGGYWRYPALVDFCYLVNPFYPKPSMVNEMKASFETLLRQYPSGQGVNSLLAAKNFGIHQDQVVVGNGAAELIKVLMELLPGKFGFVRPTFEEYPNRTVEERSVVYIPEENDFRYGVEDLITFFDAHPIDTLVLINPDNPTGNYIPQKDLHRLLDWGKEKGVFLIIDESFSDFARDEDNTLIHEDILKEYPGLVLMKSISKSYGVPGLRLGIAASGNTELIARLKKAVSIWNINSFGEFYLQIAEKYQKDFAESITLLQLERDFLLQELSGMDDVRVIPSEANYIMAELTGNVSATELTKRLLCEDNLFIKDLTGKIHRDGRQFIRLAVRDRKDNEKLVQAMKKHLQQA